MKAIVWTAYGSHEVLKYREFEKPFPKNDEVLIKIYASSVTTGDCRLRASKVPMGFWMLTRLAFGITKPRRPIIGMDISGEIELIGKDVELFKKGDKVYGTTGMKLGANAQYTCLSEKSALVKKPNNITHENAVAIIFGGLTAIHFLRNKAKIQKGQKILINGASGAVGVASIQLAKYYGAEITGICGTSNIKLIEALGANKVIDYTNEDFTKNNETYDVIFDMVGNLSLHKCKKSLTKVGKLILINADLITNLLSISRNNLICGVAGESKEQLNFLKERIEAGELEAVIDRIYPLDRTDDAHRYVDRGHKKGNVIISVEHKET